MQAIRQRYWLGVQGIPYYDLTVHRAGESGKTGNPYTVTPVNGYTPPAGEMLQRRKADGTIRETDFPEGYITPQFLEGDIVASTVPLDKIRAISMRYHQIENLLFTPSIHTPNLEYFRFRGNWANLGDMDFSNNRKLYYFDISKNWINSLILPTTGPDDTDNYFTYAYLGHYSWDAPAPRQVVNILMRRAFHSNVSDSQATAVETKRFNSQTSTGTLYYDGVNYHKALIDRGWSIEHISTEEEVNFNSSNAGTATLDFMTSHHNWDLVIPDTAGWLTADQSSGNYSYAVQQITLSATANNTGAPRSTTVKLRKIKDYPRTTNNSDEHGTEFHYAATIIITQP